MASSEAIRLRAAKRRSHARARAAAAAATVLAAAWLSLAAPAAVAADASALECDGLSEARCAILTAGHALIGTPYDLDADAHVVGYGHNADTPGPTLGTGGAATVDLESGALDCSGFVRYVYAAAGIDLGAGPSDSQVDRFTRLFDQVGDAPEPGDLVFFGARVGAGAADAEYVDPRGASWDVRHVAVYAGDGMLMESTRTRDGVAPPREVYSWPADGVERIGYFTLRPDVSGAGGLDGGARVFADVRADDPDAEHMRWLRDERLTTVAADESFRPDDALRRDEAALLLYRLAGSPGTGSAAADRLTFPDVDPDSPFAEAIAWLGSSGIAPVAADAAFEPTRVVTRAEFAGLAASLVGARPEDECFGAFTDVDQETPMCDAIAWMKAQGISRGYTDGTFRPETPVTRADAAAFLHRLSTYLFDDVSLLSGDHAAIRWVTATGVMDGFPDGTFRPEEPVLRRDAVAFLHRAAGAPPLDDPEEAPYPDVEAADPAAAEIAWAAAEGLVESGDAPFRPADAVTRAEFVEMLLRLSGEDAPAQCEDVFTDAGDSAHREAICWAAQRGVAVGYGDGTFRPDAPTTRGSAAVMLDRYVSRAQS